jgi:5-oxoprolinase (ATP-hydrolysing) subunit B
MKKLDPTDMGFYLMGERATVMQSHAAADLPCQRKIWGIAQQLRIAGNYLDIVPGMNNLTVIFDPEKTSGERVLAVLQAK